MKWSLQVQKIFWRQVNKSLTRLFSSGYYPTIQQLLPTNPLIARQGAAIAQNLAQKQTLTTNVTNDPFVQKFTQLQSKEHQVIQEPTPQRQEQENVGLANLYFSNETNGKNCETDMHTHR